MKTSLSTGIAFTMLVAAGAFTLSAQGAKAAEESKAKQALLSSIDQCEMLDRTDARESCMDQAWAAFKKAHAMEAKTK